MHEWNMLPESVTVVTLDGKSECMQLNSTKFCMRKADAKKSVTFSGLHHEFTTLWWALIKNTTTSLKTGTTITCS